MRIDLQQQKPVEEDARSNSWELSQLSRWDQFTDVHLRLGPRRLQQRKEERSQDDFQDQDEDEQ
ncbi:MAG: hypothetical protein GY861_15610 [bacterium]|nr:hypothetical protein [bacterium]